MLLEVREGTVNPDYFQFYLQTSTGRLAADEVTDIGYEAHLEATSPGFVYVGTLKKYGSTPVRVELHDREPETPSAAWQHVVDVSITGDGRLDVQSWSGDVTMSVATPSGPLRVRALWARLEFGLPGGTRDEDTSDEHVLFQIWPAPQADRKVLRWWHEWELPPRSATAPDGRLQIEGQDDVVARISGRMRSVPVWFESIASAPALPGGGTGRCSGVWGDPADGTWWVDGYAERRLLRPITDQEALDLIRVSRPAPEGPVQPPFDSRWDEMLARLGLGGR